jgi:phosphoketolase
MEALFPASMTRRVMLTHMRPEVMRGHLHSLFPMPARSRVLGYINQGGTFDQAGMLFANRCTWAHVLAAAAITAPETNSQHWMDEQEWAAIGCHGNPAILR